MCFTRCDKSDRFTFRETLLKFIPKSLENACFKTLERFMSKAPLFMKGFPLKNEATNFAQTSPQGRFRTPLCCVIALDAPPAMVQVHQKIDKTVIGSFAKIDKS